jgi:hypothetical protein
LYINPTIVNQGGIEQTFDSNITYVIFNPDGNVATTIDRNIPLYEFTIVVKKGFGEDAWSEHGYSGITNIIEENVIIDDDTIISDINEFGWGDNGFGEGPFGGSYIRTLEEVASLIEARENSVIGSIAIAEIDFTSKIEDAEIFGIKTLSRSKVCPITTRHIFSGSLWHQSIDGNYIDADLAAGIIQLKSKTGISIPGRKISANMMNYDLQFDISRFTTFLDGAGLLDTSNITTNPTVLSLASIYDNFKHDSTLDIQALQLFEKAEDGTITPFTFGTGYVVSNDLSTITIQVSTAYAGKIIGLGLNHDPNFTYPTLFFEI